MSLRDMSLSQRLLVGLLVVTFAFWAVIAVLTVRDSIDDTYELFDAHLRQTAVALLSAVRLGEEPSKASAGKPDQPSLREIFASGFGPAGGEQAPLASAWTDWLTLRALDLQYEKLLRYQIWAGDGRRLLRSANSPEDAMVARDGFSELADADGRIWRSFSFLDQRSGYRVQVSEAHDVRNRLVRDIALHVASPLVLGLPVLVFLLWFSVTRGLDPLGRLTQQIEERKPDNLLPLELPGVPKELRPVVESLNRLLGRVAGALDSERRLTANAAHELRTPLAAIQAHLHSVRCTNIPRECEGEMAQLHRSVERGIRLVGQLLALARLDPEQKLPNPEQVEVAGVAETVGAELAPLALHKQQTLQLHVEGALPNVPGNTDLLSALFANLIDNAIRYTPRGGHIVVDLRGEGSGVRVAVSDDGPGIPREQRLAVFERFYRLAGQDQPGSGLGLAIVRRVVDLHDASIEIGDGPGGRGVTVTVVLRGGGPPP